MSGEVFRLTKTSREFKEKKVHDDQEMIMLIIHFLKRKKIVILIMATTHNLAF